MDPLQLVLLEVVKQRIDIVISLLEHRESIEIEVAQLKAALQEINTVLQRS